jgi:putative SOS response-associated peptidase YedK
MCGRFALSIIPARFAAAFGVEPPEVEGRWNIAPDTPILVVRLDREGRREAVPLRWGILGPWMTDAKDPARQINARVESAGTKPMFRDAFRKGRCLIPADGFYEWQKRKEGPSQPFYIRRRDGEPLAFAGIWRANRLADGKRFDSCAILTTDAHPSLRPIHHRMPLMLPASAYAAWLDPGIMDVPAPLDEAALEAYPVSTAVNSPRQEGAGLVTPQPPRGAPAEGQPQLL